MKDHEEIENTVAHQQGLEFWFSRRQPRYIDNFVRLWGEDFDDYNRSRYEQTTDKD